MLEDYFKHFATNFQNFPMTFDDFRRFHKNFKLLEGLAFKAGALLTLC